MENDTQRKYGIEIVKYHPTLKRKAILKHATTQMNLEVILLSEITQWKRTNIVYFHIYEALKIVKFIETESRIVVVRTLEKEIMDSYCLMDTVSVWDNEKSSGDG